MPRGFQVDIPATLSGIFRSNVRNGRLKPRTSFISKPKIIKGECTEPKPHLILYGKDKAPIRAEIFRRNREANSLVIGGTALCWKCGRMVWESLPDWLDGGEEIGEWDHIRNKAGERCDCPENGRVACDACHSERHPKPMFGIKKEATK